VSGSERGELPQRVDNGNAIYSKTYSPIPDVAHNGKSIAKYGYAFIRNRFGETEYLSCVVPSTRDSQRWLDRL
jgi:hypothetical protein